MTSDAIDELRRLGCSDGFCEIAGKATGMHTNGGCHCTRDPLRTVQALRLLRAEVERLTRERDEALFDKRQAVTTVHACNTPGARHTAGPWHREGTIVYTRWLDAHGYHIAVGRCDRWQDAEFIATTPEMEAKLERAEADRAALLAACEAVVEHCHYDTCTIELIGGPEDGCSCPVKACRAAIARARGEAARGTTTEGTRG